MVKKVWCLIIFLLLTCGLAVAPALAATPTVFVKDILDEVITIQNKPALEGPAHEAARAKAICLIIQRKFDFAHMAQSTLGAAYGGLSASQRQEFTDVFSSLFQASYTNMVLRFLKQETVKYGKESLSGGQARVSTTLMRANDAIQVDYLLQQKGGGWLLYDVEVDGVSILEQYRSGFAREIQARSFASLLEKMKTQLKAVQ
jgi:phospholipid transport system substrate-binding protein